MDLITFDIIDHLKSSKNFSFSRFGDGEWACIMNKQGQNCDAHIYYPDLGQRLKNILISQPKYIIGLQNLAYRLHPNLIDTFTKDYQLKWVLSDILHHMSIKENLKPFFEALKGKNIILVAPDRLKALSIWNQFISISQTNCWNDYELVKKEISLAIKKDSVVLYCASMMTNVLIDDFKNEDITQIDCGSIFEPYIGIANRTYHKDKINQLKKNE